MSFKKVLSILLVGCTIFSAVALTGCNKERGPVYSKRTNVYAETPLSVPESVDWVQYSATSSDRYFLSYTKMVEVEVTYPTHGFYEDDYIPYTEPVIETAVVTAETTADTRPVVDGDFAVDEDMIVDVEPEIPSDGETFIETQYQNWIYSNTYDGSDPSDFYLDLGTPEGYVQSMFADEAGNLYILYNSWVYPDDGSMAYSTFKLFQLDGKDGSVKSEKDLGTMLAAAGVDTTDAYINGVTYSNNRLFISMQTNLYVVDMTTDTILSKYESQYWIDNVVVDGDTAYFTSYMDNGGNALFGVNALTGQETRYDTENLKSVVNSMCCGVRDGVIYFQSAGGISYWDSINDKAGELINYLNSDVDSSYINTIQVMDDGRLFYSGSMYENEKNTVMVSVLERIPDENLKEEIIITVASEYMNYELRRAAIRFNKQNTGVRVSMKEYFQYNTEENEYTGAVTQMNADITMGNVPDILLISSGLPVESYFNKDVFVDLNQYIDDPEVGLNRGDYYENLLNLTNVNGKLYTLIPRLSLKTLVAKSKFVGTESGWNVAEMLDVIRKMPEGMEAFSYDYDRSQIQNFLIESCSNAFVDWENATTNFNSQEFIDLIEFIKSCPELSINNQHYANIDYDNYDYQEEDAYWNNYSMRFYRDQALFQDYALWDLNEITYLYQNFADEITLIGYPTNDEGSSGAVVVPQMELGICTKSPNHDSSWMFIRFLMTDEGVQNSMNGLSSNRVYMEKKLAESEEAYADYYYEYTDEDWAWYEETYSAEYVEYMKKSRTKYSIEHGQKIIDILAKATMVQRSDNSLNKIINEELSYFYGGTRDAAATAKVIDNITNLYVTENS